MTKLREEYAVLGSHLKQLEKLAATQAAALSVIRDQLRALVRGALSVADDSLANQITSVNSTNAHSPAGHNSFVECHTLTADVRHPSYLVW